jgi:hypothetical protein
METKVKPELKFLDQAIDRMRERITIERLSERVPAIRAIMQERDALHKIVYRASLMFQRYPLSVTVDESGELTADGLHSAQEAQEAISKTILMLRMTATK